MSLVGSLPSRLAGPPIGTCGQTPRVRAGRLSSEAQGIINLNHINHTRGALKKFYFITRDRSIRNTKEVLVITLTDFPVYDCPYVGDSASQRPVLLFSVAVVVPRSWVNVRGDDNGGGKERDVSSFDLQLGVVLVEKDKEILQRQFRGCSGEVIEKKALFSIVTVEPLRVRRLGVKAGSVAGTSCE
jgi:hypothetical protein